MHVLPSVLLSLLALEAQAANIVSTNDDGWAEINIRAFYNALKGAGHDVVLSAPAVDKSGTGMGTTIYLLLFYSDLRSLIDMYC